MEAQVYQGMCNCPDQSEHGLPAPVNSRVLVLWNHIPIGKFTGMSKSLIILKAKPAA